MSRRVNEPMRLILLFCSLSAASVVAAQSVTVLPVPGDLKADGAAAEREGKPLILFFHFRVASSVM